jgi:probable HAF family extracellular repeat protein
VIVGWSTNLTGHKRPVLWEEGAVTDLGSFGGTEGVAYGINAEGVVVGFSRRPGGTPWAFSWTNGVMTALARAPAGGSDFGSSIAYAINSGGTIAGNCGPMACVWKDGAHSMLRLAGSIGSLPGSARAISDDGTVAVDSEMRQNSQGMVWKDGAGYWLNPAGGRMSRAFAVGPDGTIGGEGEYLRGEGAIVWNP